MEFLVWPAAAVILGTVATFVFRKPLVRFIDRSTGFRIGKHGIDAPLPHQAPQSRSMLPAGDSTRTKRPEPLETVFGQTILKETETEIHDYMEKRNIPEEAMLMT